jgi:CBS domain-containing protein
MSKKNIFICYSGKDEESVFEFKTILNACVKIAGLSDKVSITDMYDIPSGKPRFIENANQIKNADIFLLMISPNFLESHASMNNEVPAVFGYVVKGIKDAFPINFIETDDPFTNNVYLKGSQFFVSARARELKFFTQEIGDNTISQRYMFVEDLVQKIKPLVGGAASQNSNLINDIRDLPHLVDFMNGKSTRILRVCNEKDTLMYAEYLMKVLSPPMRHLLVVNDAGDLTGLISIRDILKYGSKNKVKKEDNLVFFDLAAKNEPVSAQCRPIDQMLYYALSKENKIEDVISQFINCQHTGKPIGVIPVIRNDNVFSEGTFEIVSYIDILDNWEKLPISDDLRAKKVSEMKKDEENLIETVRDTDEIVVAHMKMLKGLRSIPVVDRDNKYVGIIADTDLLGGEGEAKPKEKVNTILRKKPKTTQIDSKADFNSVVKFFTKYREYTSLPVLTTDGKIEKMIGHTDILKMIQESIVSNKSEQ